MGIWSYLKCSDTYSNRFFHSSQNEIYYLIANYVPDFLYPYFRRDLWFVWFRTFMAVYYVGFVRWFSLGNTFRTMGRTSSLKKKIKLPSSHLQALSVKSPTSITGILVLCAHEKGNIHSLGFFGDGWVF